MSDLIRRQDAINKIHKYFVEEIDKTPREIDEDGYDVYTDMKTVNALLAHNKKISKAIKALPSAGKPKGRWVLSIEGHYCSNCYAKCLTTALPTRCPNCGADMRGEEEWKEKD